MNYKDYTYEHTNCAMTPIQYEHLIDLLKNFKPKRICELGSGESTKIFEKYISTNNNTTLVSIEHDNKYKRKNTIILPLIDTATFAIINGKFYSTCNKYYGLEDWLKTQDKFDFILIDGPFGYGKRIEYTYSRIQILSFVLFDKISDDAYILYHDSERSNAITTLNEFERLLNEKNISFEKTELGKIPKLTLYHLKKNIYK